MSGLGRQNNLKMENGAHGGPGRDTLGSQWGFLLGSYGEPIGILVGSYLDPTGLIGSELLAGIAQIAHAARMEREALLFLLPLRRQRLRERVVLGVVPGAEGRGNVRLLRP